MSSHPLHVFSDTKSWDYPALLGPPERLMECALGNHGDASPAAEANLLCSERHLQILWLEQKAFSALRTANNQPIEVIHPGIWNQGPGPDFLHAHLRINGASYQGPIELHLVDQGWVQHGHDSDPRYEEVILHIALEPPHTQKPLFTQLGRSLERTYLGPFLHTPLQTLLTAIDLDLYPSPSCTKPGDCAIALFETLSPGQIRDFFHSAALWRLRQKRLFLASLSADPSMQCAMGMALGLGYKQNAQAMLKLFLHLWPYRHVEREALLSYALGLCGFFNDHYLTLWKNSLYHQELHKLWTNSLLPKEQQFPLVTAQQRPAHHPVRRLAALTYMLQDTNLLTTWSRFQELWQSLYKQYGPFTAKTAKIKQALIGFLPDYKQPYWNTHYTFESQGSAPDLSLLGEERREIILINVFFPLLWYAILLRADPIEKDSFITLFSSWKTVASAKQRYISRRFFASNDPLAPLANSMMEQGAFQLHGDFCTHYEASCVGCPFVARAQEQLSTQQSLK